MIRKHRVTGLDVTFLDQDLRALDKPYTTMLYESTSVLNSTAGDQASKPHFCGQHNEPCLVPVRRCETYKLLIESFGALVFKIYERTTTTINSKYFQVRDMIS